MSFPLTLTLESGREVQIIGRTAWSGSYFDVVVDGVPSVRPASLVLAHLTPNERSHIVARKKQDTPLDPNVAASSVMISPVREDTENAENGGVQVFEDSVDDTVDVEKNSTAENQAIVDQAVSKPKEDEEPVEEPKKDEPKPKAEKAPSTAEVAVAWIVAQLEEHGPLTKERLAELAEQSNPAKFPHATKPGRKIPRPTKWIVEHKKVGQMIGGNASGYYIPEGLDAGRNGGVQFVYADEEKKTLKVK